jgi:hypothetical protein
MGGIVGSDNGRFSACELNSCRFDGGARDVFGSIGDSFSDSNKDAAAPGSCVVVSVFSYN